VAGTNGTVIVSDAISAAGLGPGKYPLAEPDLLWTEKNESPGLAGGNRLTCQQTLTTLDRGFRFALDTELGPLTAYPLVGAIN
jgi:N-acetylglucosamine-6-phosphate deacetylase